MKRRLAYSNKAVEDLTSIWQYTVRVWSEKQADEYYGMLISTCNLLSSTSPAGSKKYEDIMPDLYGLHCGHHIIFYILLSQDDILIARILHEKMDIRRHFPETTD